MPPANATATSSGKICPVRRANPTAPSNLTSPPPIQPRHQHRTARLKIISPDNNPSRMCPVATEITPLKIASIRTRRFETVLVATSCIDAAARTIAIPITQYGTTEVADTNNVQRSITRYKGAIDPPEYRHMGQHLVTNPEKARTRLLSHCKQRHAEHHNQPDNQVTTNIATLYRPHVRSIRNYRHQHLAHPRK